MLIHQRVKLGLITPMPVLSEFPALAKFTIEAKARQNVPFWTTRGYGWFKTVFPSAPASLSHPGWAQLKKQFRILRHVRCILHLTCLRRLCWVIKSLPLHFHILLPGEWSWCRFRLRLRGGSWWDRAAGRGVWGLFPRPSGVLTVPLMLG